MMLKKFVLLGLVLLLLLMSAKVILAADALYRMLHADEVVEFQKDQTALIVGQLIDKQDRYFTVKVLKILSGNVSSERILVEDGFTYGWNKAVPKLEDFAVFSLKKSGAVYQKAWGIFIATEGDYRRLQLKPLNAPSPGLMTDLAAIQWYVNSGGIEKDFFFHSTTASVRRPDGQVLQIYPPPEGKGEAAVYEQAVNNVQNMPVVKESFTGDPLRAIGLGALGLLIGAVVLYRIIDRMIKNKG